LAKTFPSSKTVETHARFYNILAADVAFTILGMFDDPATLQSLREGATIRTAIPACSRVENMQLPTMQPDWPAFHNHSVTRDGIAADQQVSQYPRVNTMGVKLVG
jgi:hypothetical protein